MGGEPAQDVLGDERVQQRAVLLGGALGALGDGELLAGEALADAAHEGGGEAGGELEGERGDQQPGAAADGEDGGGEEERLGGGGGERGERAHAEDGGEDADEGVEGEDVAGEDEVVAADGGADEGPLAPRPRGVGVVAEAHRERARLVDAPGDVGGAGELELGAPHLAHQVVPHEVGVVEGGEAEADRVVVPYQEAVRRAEVRHPHQQGGDGGAEEVRPPGRRDPLPPSAGRPAVVRSEESEKKRHGEENGGYRTGCEERSWLIVGLDELIFPVGLKLG